MNDFGGNIPLLGPKPDQVKTGVGPPIALIRDLDENALFEPEATVQTPQGLMAISGRSNIVTAVDLVDMIVDALRPCIREEVAKLVREQQVVGKLTL